MPANPAEFRASTFNGVVHSLAGDGLARRVRQERQMARPLDRHGQPTLVPRACSGLTARLDLPTLRQEPAQLAAVLIVHGVDLVDAERADFSARTESPASAATTTATTTTAARPSAETA
jgi:hypothetical protein